MRIKNTYIISVTSMFFVYLLHLSMFSISFDNDTIRYIEFSTGEEPEFVDIQEPIYRFMLLSIGNVLSYNNTFYFFIFFHIGFFFIFAWELLKNVKSIYPAILLITLPSIWILNLNLWRQQISAMLICLFLIKPFEKINKNAFLAALGFHYSSFLFSPFLVLSFAPKWPPVRGLINFLPLLISIAFCLILKLNLLEGTSYAIYEISEDDNSQGRTLLIMAYAVAAFFLGKNPSLNSAGYLILLLNLLSPGSAAVGRLSHYSFIFFVASLCANKYLGVWSVVCMIVLIILNIVALSHSSVFNKFIDLLLI